MPSDFTVAHLEDIHVTATASEALSDTNKLEGLKSFPLTITTELSELKHLNSDGWSRYKAVWKTGSGSFAGDVLKGSATQAVLDAAEASGDSIFVHCIEDSTAVAGSQGKRYEFVIESAEKPREAGVLRSFSYSVKLNGPPVAI
jgi:hypothetical protein